MNDLHDYVLCDVQHITNDIGVPVVLITSSFGIVSTLASHDIAMTATGVWRTCFGRCCFALWRCCFALWRCCLAFGRCCLAFGRCLWRLTRSYCCQRVIRVLAQMRWHFAKNVLSGWCAVAYLRQTQFIGHKRTHAFDMLYSRTSCIYENINFFC